MQSLEFSARRRARFPKKLSRSIGNSPYDTIIEMITAYPEMYRGRMFLKEQVICVAAVAVLK